MAEAAPSFLPPVTRIWCREPPPRLILPRRKPLLLGSPAAPLPVPVVLLTSCPWYIKEATLQLACTLLLLLENRETQELAEMEEHPNEVHCGNLLAA